MKFVHRIKKPFKYTPAKEMEGDTAYLKRKFDIIRKQIKDQQETEAKQLAEQQSKVRKIK